VTCYARTIKAGTSSVTVEVEVEAERYIGGEVVPVTRATLVMVSVDSTGKAIPYRSAPTASAVSV
jgi:acyl-CoA hydrolase